MVRSHTYLYIYIYRRCIGEKCSKRTYKHCYGTMENMPFLLMEECLVALDKTRKNILGFGILFIDIFITLVWMLSCMVIVY